MADAEAGADGPYPLAIVRGFRAFILRGNVVDLAVGIVIGAAFNSVVNAIVNDFIKPLISLLGGESDYARYYFTVHGNRFLYGDFLGNLLTFLIDAAVVYAFVVTPYKSLQERFMPGRPPAPTKECPECLSRIPAGARRCMYCTCQV
ncbi:MAG TPA: large conductance mechanosensitive channel protein MscL [Candidatus Dormibacteraeota bacterium]